MLLCKCMRTDCPNPHAADAPERECIVQNPHDIANRLNRHLLPLYGNTGAGLELSYEEIGNDGKALGGSGA